MTAYLIDEDEGVYCHQGHKSFTEQVADIVFLVWWNKRILYCLSYNQSVKHKWQQKEANIPVWSEKLQESMLSQKLQYILVHETVEELNDLWYR